MTMQQQVLVGPHALGGDLFVPASAHGLVVFVHGSGGSRHSPRNRYVTEVLHTRRLGTLLFDLLSESEARDAANVFGIGLLARRLLQAMAWVRTQPRLSGLRLGLFGASTGAAAALVAAAERPQEVSAVVSRGGRPDLAGAAVLGRAYLLRLRKTANVKRLIERLFRREDWTRATEASQGWQAIEDSIKLSGWSRARRVVVLRRRIKHDIALTAKKGSKARDDADQLVLALPHDEVQDNAQVWEYTVLVTNAEYDIAAIGQLYRDRCDCENGFDELKNQWGWGGFTTHDMHRSQITARAVALVYNWWSWYVRAAHPQARREALTSRPLLLAAVGRAVSHSGQTTLYLTPMHAEAGLIKSMIANVQAAIRHVKNAAEQLPQLDRWRALVTYICQRIVGHTALPTPPPMLAAPG